MTAIWRSGKKQQQIPSFLVLLRVLSGKNAFKNFGKGWQGDASLKSWE
jgi:hypothetical protein